MTYLIGDNVFGQVNSSGTASYFVIDGHGSTRALVSSTGSVTATFNYFAYGNPLGSWGLNTAGTIFLFGGDAVYDPASGLYMNGDGTRDRSGFEFIQRDTSSGDNTDPLSLHTYLYADADSINGFDPSGHDDVFDTLVLMGMDSVITLGSTQLSATTAPSTTAPSTQPSSYDITAHLVAIRTHLLTQYAGMSNAQKQGLANAFNGGFLANQAANWDIVDLKTDLHMSGLLGGVYTCTVGGKVYRDEDVDYWLYGVWACLLGKYAWLCEAKIRLHCFMQYDAAGRIAWFKAGFNNNMGLAASAAIAGATPALPPSQGGPEFGPLIWYVGNSLGSARGKD